MGAVSPTAGTVCWPTRRIRISVATPLGRAVKNSGKSRWELEVIVRRSYNFSADVPYSALFNEALGVVMWTVVLFVMCLNFFSSSAMSSRKMGCHAFMTKR